MNLISSSQNNVMCNIMPSVRFSRQREEAYQTDLNQKRFTQVRAAIIVGISIATIFLIIDFIEIETAPNLWKFRMIFLLCVLPLPWYLFAMPEHAKRHLHCVQIVMAYYASIGLLLLEALLIQAKLDRGITATIPYLEIIPSRLLVTIFVFAPLATPLVPATVICLLSALATTLLGWHSAVHPALLLESLFAMLAVISIGVLFSRQFDIYSRREFVQMQHSEEQRRAAESLAEERIRFIRDASHNLSQPVQAMIAHNVALEAELKNLGEVAYPVMPTANTLFLSIQELSSSFNQILALSRLHETNGVACASVTPIHRILEKVYLQYFRIASTKRLALHVKKPCLWGFSDEVLLWQIVSNLVDNAVKYTIHGWVLINATRVGSNIRIHVVDTGVGIADKHKGDIFKEFFRLENGLGVSGSGVGLASVKKMLDRLPSHRLHLHSKVGVGTHFCLSLPASSSNDVYQQTNVSAQTDSRGDGKLILVVDDNVQVLRALEKALKLRHYQVIAAGSATEARLVLQGHRDTPHIVVTDWQLQDGETAEDVVRCVQDLCGAVPIVILSGELRAGNLVFLEGQECRMLKKPVDIAHLVETINRLTASHA